MVPAIVVDIALWGSEDWTLKEADRSKLEAFLTLWLSSQDVRVDDVECSRGETDHERAREKNCCKFTHRQWTR
jgi:hypothetical protein